MKQLNSFNPKTHTFKEFSVQDVHHSRYNKVFNSQDEMDKYVGSSELLSVYNMNVLPGGKIDAVIDERRHIVIFYNEVSRRYFVENNNDYSVVEEVIYNNKPAVWVEPK